MDTNLDGSPGKSDPYMVVKLGIVIVMMMMMVVKLMMEGDDDW